MYSAGFGEFALDRLDDTDTNPNSVYTRSLLPLLRTANLPLAAIAQRVREDVRRLAAAVNYKQTPAYYDQVVGQACLVGSCGADAEPQVTLGFDPQHQGPTAWTPAIKAIIPSNDKPSEGCLVVGSKIEKPVLIQVGTQLCAKNGEGRAVIHKITSYYIVYSTQGNGMVTCKKLELCSFNWRNAPLFNIGVVANSGNGEYHAKILPYVH